MKACEAIGSKKSLTCLLAGTKKTIWNAKTVKGRPS